MFEFKDLKSMHIRKPCPPFFQANKFGCPYGLEDGTILPVSSSADNYSFNSADSSSLRGYKRCFAGGLAGSIKGIVNGTQSALDMLEHQTQQGKTVTTHPKPFPTFHSVHF